MSKKIIALVGGTGHLGSLIANALLDKEEIHLRLLVRPDSINKAKALVERGAEVIEGSIGEDQNDALDKLCKDASTLISSLQGGPDVIIDGQKTLLKAAKKAGVNRFIPSDYSLDLFKVKPGDIPTSDMRYQFATIADGECGDVEIVHILNGGFLDKGVMFNFLRVIDVENQVANVWGDGQQLMDWTTYEDTAKYTAEVAVDDRSVPRIFSIAGNVISFKEIVAEFESASGKKLLIKCLGSLQELDSRIEGLQNDSSSNLYTYLPLMYYRSLLNGEGKIDEIMNERYPSIKPVTVYNYILNEIL